MKPSLGRLAWVTGVAASTISRIESGHLSPTLDIVEKLTGALHLGPLAGNASPSVTPADAEALRAREEQTHEPLAPVVYRKIGNTTSGKGIRRDLSGIAARNGYEMAVVVKGTFQLRTNDDFGENVKPGATINCKRIAKHTYFAIAAEDAELLLMSGPPQENFNDTDAQQAGYAGQAQQANDEKRQLHHVL